MTRTKQLINHWSSLHHSLQHYLNGIKQDPRIITEWVIAMTITMSVRENTLRCNINAQIKLLDAIWERLVISASLRSAGAAITKYKGLIRDLETESLTQIGKIVDDAERDLNQNDWCTFLLDVEGKIDAHQHQLDTKQGLAPASSELPTAKSAQHEISVRADIE